MKYEKAFQFFETAIANSVQPYYKDYEIARTNSLLHINYSQQQQQKVEGIEEEAVKTSESKLVKVENIFQHSIRERMSRFGGKCCKEVSSKLSKESGLPSIIFDNLSLCEIGRVLFYGGDSGEDNFIISKDNSLSYSYYSKASNGGSALAHYELSIMRENGYGCQKDTKRSIQLLEYAAEIPLFKYTPTKYTPTNHKFNNIETMVNKGIAESQYKLGEINELENNHSKSFNYYKRAVENNYLLAFGKLGLMIYNGVDGIVKCDKIEGRELLKKGAECGDVNSMWKFALILKQELNYIDSIKWLEKAIENNHVHSQIELTRLIEIISIQNNNSSPVILLPSNVPVVTSATSATTINSTKKFKKKKSTTTTSTTSTTTTTTTNVSPVSPITSVQQFNTPTSPSIIITNQNYYYKIQRLLEILLVKLKKRYKENYEIEFSVQWRDNDTAHITAITNNGIKFLLAHQENIVLTGDIDKWDISILSNMLLNFKYSKLQITVKEIDQINQIQEIRNQINHLSNKTLNSNQFESYRVKLNQLLLEFGKCNQEFIDNEISSVNVVVVDEFVDNGEIEVSKLKEKGNIHFSKNEFTESIKVYTDAINFKKLISNNLKTILYSNRSKSYIELYKIKSTNGTLLNGGTGLLNNALKDALMAIELEPTIGKWLFRLADIYYYLEDYEKSEQYIDEAIEKEPENKVYKNKLYELRVITSCNRRDDNETMGKLQESMNQQLKSTMSSNHLNFIEERIKNQFSVPLPSNLSKQSKQYFTNCETCQNAHFYFNGSTKIKKDMEKAIYYFKKAAENESAEGIYNLALIYEHGIGVKVDIPLHVKLLKLASKLPPTIVVPNDFGEGKEFIPILGTSTKFIDQLGVKEAQHALGLCYHDGIGVEQDLNMARHYYELAIKNDNGSNSNGSSHNNLGIMYYCGDGVPWNPILGKSLITEGANRGDVNAMEMMGLIYLDDENDLAKARQWFNKAVDKGSQYAKLQLIEIDKKLKK